MIPEPGDDPFVRALIITKWLLVLTILGCTIVLGAIVAQDTTPLDPEIRIFLEEVLKSSTFPLG